MSDKRLSIYYQNCRGIRTKLHTLYMNILNSNHDIIVLTETWLIPEISNNEFVDQRYVVYRCDRDRVSTNKQDGGGVLVALLRTLKPSELDLSVTQANLSSCNLIEHVLIEVPSTRPSKRHVISATYIPPRTASFVYEQHFEALQEVLSDPGVDCFYMLGDYNLPEITWNIPGPTSPLNSIDCGTSVSCTQLNNLMSLLDALQYNDVVNTKGKILDLLISNHPCRVSTTLCPLLPVDAYHPPFICEMNLNVDMLPMIKRPLQKYNYYKSDYEQIKRKIQDVNWTELLAPLASEEALSTFYNKIDDIIKQHTPLTASRISGFPVWFSKSLISTFRKKQKAWVKWKKFNNISDYEKFSQYRALFKDMCKKCFSKYIQSVEDSIRTNIKDFWVYISNRKDKPGIPAKVQYKDNVSNDPQLICNLFSSFFSSVYEPASPTLFKWEPPSDTAPNDLTITDIQFKEEKVMAELKSLDPSKGPGPDGLSALFLRNTASVICRPLTVIYNKCLSEGVMPTVWKHANITPVHKGGSKRSVEQYRPISILSALSKLLERLVHNELYPILHNAIIQQQHGFVKRRSTTTNLLIFSSYLFDNVDNRVQVDAVYTDFRKAFDKVDHELLLNRIAYNGIRGNLLRWFTSYITNRCQKVVINGFCSDATEVTSGVPQGSILGPLLFVIFINDISKCFHNSKFLLYADDLKIYRSIRNIQDCYLLQEDLDRLTNYCYTSKLQLSVPKCNFINFTKNKTIITFAYSLCNISLNKVNCVRDLGVLLDSKLCLDLHIEQIVNRAYQMYGFIMRSSRDFKRTSSYLCLYKTLVRSQLEYAVPIWNPYYNKYVDMIENVQRRFLRAMHYRCHKLYLPYDQLLGKYKILTLSSRRKQLEAITLYNIVNNKFDCIELNNVLCYAVPRTIHRRQVRAGKLFAIGTCRTNTGLRSPIRRMAETYNVIFEHIDIFLCSMIRFRNLVYETLSS